MSQEFILFYMIYWYFFSDDDDLMSLDGAREKYDITFSPVSITPDPPS